MLSIRKLFEVGLRMAGARVRGLNTRGGAPGGLGAGRRKG